MICRQQIITLDGCEEELIQQLICQDGTFFIIQYQPSFCDMITVCDAIRLQVPGMMCVWCCCIWPCLVVAIMTKRWRQISVSSHLVCTLITVWKEQRARPIDRSITGTLRSQDGTLCLASCCNYDVLVMLLSCSERQGIGIIVCSRVNYRSQ